MTPHPDNLVWIDLEMTGLVPETDRIIEIATIVTDKELVVLAEGPVIAVHQSDEMLARMDDWNTRTHGNSGLTARVRDSLVSEAAAQQAMGHAGVVQVPTDPAAEPWPPMRAGIGL
jgi:oligoribonuclease